MKRLHGIAAIFAALILIAGSGVFFACGGADDDDDDDDGDNMPNLTWIAVSGGSFSMGCSPDDADCQTDENPAHTVTVSSFEMTETEITQEQFEILRGYNPSTHADCPNCPVDSIDWATADAYCEEVGGRLPTEAEWEYAARGGKTARYYCGDDGSCLSGIGWFIGNSDEMSHEVAQKSANAYGLYDMLGNLWEWVSDYYEETYYSEEDADNPTGPDSGEMNVLRGGAWESAAEGDPVFGTLRVSDRNPLGGANGTKYTGFRCVR